MDAEFDVHLHDSTSGKRETVVVSGEDTMGRFWRIVGEALGLQHGSFSAVFEEEVLPREGCVADTDLHAGAEVAVVVETPFLGLQRLKELGVEHVNRAAFIAAATEGNLEKVKCFMSLRPHMEELKGDSPLQAAVRNDHTHIVRHMVEVDGSSAAIVIILKNHMQYGEQQLLAAVNLVLECGADVNSRSEAGEPPLLYAANLSRPVLCRLLIEKGAHVNVMSDSQVAPLHAAARHGSVDNVMLLLDKGADVHATGSFGETPLHAAVEMGRTAAAKALLDKGANPNKANAIGETPLHRAAYYTSAETVALLLAAGAKPSVLSQHGDSPLHYAALHNRFVAAELLLKYGAEVNHANNFGVSPLDHVDHVANDSKDLLLLLKSHGARASIGKRNQRKYVCICS